MQPVALVTGSPERVADVSSALKQAGYEAVPAEDLSRLDEVAGSQARESVDAFIQLPVDVQSPSGENLVEQIRDLITQGLLARFDTAVKVLPLLKPDATVVLVAGNRPQRDLEADDRHARLDLLRVLAHAILSERQSRGLRCTVVDDRRSPGEIVDIVRHHGTLPAPVASLADYKPELSYDDWLLEVLSLCGTEG